MSTCDIPVSAQITVCDGKISSYRPDMRQVESTILADLLIRGFGIDPANIDVLQTKEETIANEQREVVATQGNCCYTPREALAED